MKKNQEIKKIFMEKLIYKGKDKKKMARPVMRVGVYKKPVILLWVILIFSVTFGIYKNFTAIDRHTTKEEKVIQLRLSDTNGIANFVENFANKYYTWDNNKDSIEARKTSLNDYLTNDLQSLNTDLVRLDIPTSSKVENVQIWSIKQSDTSVFLVNFEVKQIITNNGTIQDVRANYTVKVYVDDVGNMVIIQNPTLAPAIEKSTYEVKQKQSDGSIDSNMQKEAISFLETFFKLYPKASNTELSYYVTKDQMQPINKDYLYAELMNPIFVKEGDDLRVQLSVKYIDNSTKAMQISQYDLTLQKDTNWKIKIVH